MKRSIRPWSVCLTLLALSTPARAQQAAADALFDSARAAMAKGDLATACGQFRASNKLDPAVGTELNLADCEEQRGHLASAWELYRTVEEKLADKDERLALARARAQALSARLPRLTLQLAAGAPKDSSVRDGQVELGSAVFGIALPLEPGAHEIVISAPGFEPRSFRVQLAEGEKQSLVVAPGAARVVGPSPPSPVVPAAPANRASAPDKRTLGFVLGGVGLGGLSVGAIAGLLVLGKQHTVDDECQPDKTCSSAGISAAKSGRNLQVLANVGWVVGVAALGAGTYFLLTSGPSNQPSTRVGFSSTVAGGQLSLTRSW